MKISSKTTLASLIAAVTVTTLIAAPIASAKGNKRGGSVEAIFAKLDTSGDEVLVSSELVTMAQTRAEKRFDRKDSDDDGFVSLEEATTTRRGEVTDLSDIAEEIVACVAAEQEATGDDTIVVPSADRFQSPEDKFNEIDTSGDGMIELTEAQAAAETRATESFATMDADSDGQVTLEEFTAHKEASITTRRAIRECIKDLTEEDSVV